MTYKRLDRAIQLAAKWHAGEERDGEHPLPYVTHPIEVLLNLRHVGGVTDEDMLCAAALHDVIEETDATLADIERAMGPSVRDLVQELTRREPGPEETQGLAKDQVWQLRADILLQEISKMSPKAQTIKLADRLANVREAKRTKTLKKTARYLHQTARILRVIPVTVNPSLWQAIRQELPEEADISLG